MKQYVRIQCSHIEGTFDLDWHIYGKDQVSAHPEHVGQPSEIFLVGEALASSQELATSVAHTARVATIVSCIHRYTRSYILILNSMAHIKARKPHRETLPMELAVGPYLTLGLVQVSVYTILWY